MCSGYHMQWLPMSCGKITEGEHGSISKFAAAATRTSVLQPSGSLLQPSSSLDQVRGPLTQEPLHVPALHNVSLLTAPESARKPGIGTLCHEREMAAT